MLVIDISHHNTVDSFNKIYDSGIRGVIHKATQGAGMVDVFYEKRRNDAENAGLLWGAYHFGDSSDADQQAKHFLDIAAPDDKTLMALDYEPLGSTTMSLKSAQTFLTDIDQTLSRNNVLYSGNLIKEQLTIKDAAGWWKKHPLWLAQYGRAMTIPDQWKDNGVFLWQFSDGNVNLQGTTVDGISGQVDRNSFTGTVDDLKAAWVVSTKVDVVTGVTIPPTSVPTTVANTQVEVEPPAPEPTSWWSKFFG